VTVDANDTTGKPHVLRVLIRRGEDESWQAQALECDVKAIGATRSAALDALVKVIEVHVAHDAKQGREPLSSFAAAPDHYWAEYNRAVTAAEPVELSRDDKAPVLQFLVANALSPQ
jgi:hypothetical protein